MEFEVRETPEFRAWLQSLDDIVARARILARVRRVSLGAFGDVKSVGSGILELRIACGPGYRVYLVRRQSDVVILLAGGDKSTQARDIRRAARLARDV